VTVAAVHARRLRQSALFTLIVAAILLLVSAAGPARAQSSPAGADPAQVKTQVRDILNQPEFRPEASVSAAAKLAKSIREKWDSTYRAIKQRWDGFWRWLNRLFRGSDLPGAGGVAAQVFSRVFSVAFLLLGGCLVAWLIAKLIASISLRRNAKLAKSRTAYDESEEDEGIVLEPNAWLRQAGVYAGSDDYRRAFRAVFIAMLLLLDEGGLIEFDRSRTNGDYLTLLRSKNYKRVYDLLDPLVIEFDRRWYGRAETTADDYKRIEKSFELLRAIMSEPAPSSSVAVSAGRI